MSRGIADDLRFMFRRGRGAAHRAAVPLKIWARTLKAKVTDGLPAEDVASVESFCLFLGYPRSGHSLIGSLLDAHPNAVIAHELDVLRHLRWGRFDQAHLYRLLVEQSRWFAATGSRSSGYSYTVPGQWQGRYERLRVIGDKNGARTTQQLESRPQLLDELANLVGPPRLIHVVRNPYDNISTMARRMHGPLDVFVRRYFRLVKTAASTIARQPEGMVHTMRHESLVSQPKIELSRLCDFVGLPAPPDYLDACSAIVYESPRRSRDTAHWTPPLIAVVEGEIQKYPMLAGYTFSD